MTWWPLCFLELPSNTGNILQITLLRHEIFKVAQLNQNVQTADVFPEGLWVLKAVQTCNQSRPWGASNELSAAFQGICLGCRLWTIYFSASMLVLSVKVKVLIINTYLRINTLRSQLVIKEHFMHSYFYHVVNWGQTGWYCLCTLYNVERFPFRTQWRPLFLAPVRLSAHTLSISQQNKPPNRTDWIEALTGALLYGHSVLYIKLPVVYKQTPRGEICESCGH